MLVAASTECYRDLPLREAIGKLVDLEFTNIEVGIHEDGLQLRPSQIADDLETAVNICRDTHRLNVVAY